MSIIRPSFCLFFGRKCYISLVSSYTASTKKCLFCFCVYLLAIAPCAEFWLLFESIPYSILLKTYYYCNSIACFSCVCRPELVDGASRYSVLCTVVRSHPKPLVGAPLFPDDFKNAFIAI